MINLEIKQGVVYSFLGKYSNILVTVLITSILARLISPKEFGVLAVISVFLTFFNNIFEMGFLSAIIQKEKITNEFINTIFILTIILGIILSIAFYFFSKFFIVNYYQNSEYEIIGRYLCMTLFIAMISLVPKALISREKKFKELAIITFLSNIISGMIAIILAYKEFSYYSLIWQGFFMNFFVFLFSIKFIKYFPKLYFKKEELNGFIGYSGYLFSFNIINFFSRNLDNVLIGKYFGMEVLGYYDRAYKLMGYPIAGLTYVITPVLHPVFARYQNNKNKIYDEYLKIVKILGYLGIFSSIILFFSAKEVIFILYGERWLEVVPVFKVLVCSTFIQVVLSSTGSIFMATGRSDKMFSSGCVYSGGLIIAIVIGIYLKNIYYLGIGLFVAFLFGFFAIYYSLIKKVFKKSFFRFLLTFKENVLIGMLLVMGNILVNYFIKIDNIFFSLIVKMLINLFFNIILLRMIYFRKYSLKEIIKLIKEEI